VRRPGVKRTEKKKKGKRKKPRRVKKVYKKYGGDPSSVPTWGLKKTGGTVALGTLGGKLLLKQRVRKRVVHGPDELKGLGGEKRETESPLLGRRKEVQGPKSMLATVQQEGGPKRGKGVGRKKKSGFGSFMRSFTLPFLGQRKQRGREKGGSPW